MNQIERRIRYETGNEAAYCSLLPLAGAWSLRLDIGHDKIICRVETGEPVRYDRCWRHRDRRGSVEPGTFACSEKRLMLTSAA